MIWLKQSTAVVVQFGPFLDKADGITLLANAQCITDIDHATTGIFLSKNGGDAAIRNQAVTASVADDYGMMRITLDTTDTATLGTLRVSFAKAATYLPVWADFMVVPSNVWDSMFGADKLDVNVAEQADIDFGATQKTSIKTQAAAVMTDANTELATIPTTVSGLRTMMQYIFELLRNKVTMNKDTGVETLMKEDASTPLGTRTHSDDGTTWTKPEMS